MMEAMIPSQVGMSLRTLQKIKEAKEAQIKIRRKEKNERKDRRDNVTILFPHLCFKIAPCSSYRESHMLSLPYTSGNFTL